MEGDRYREASRTDVVMGFMKDHLQAPLLRRASLGGSLFPSISPSIVSTSLGVRQRETHAECVDTAMLAGGGATQF